MNENEVLDFSNVTRENVEEYVNAGKLAYIYLDPAHPSIANRIVATPQAARKKEALDAELYNMVAQGMEVDFVIDIDYKGSSIVASKIIITLTINGNEDIRTIDVW